MLNLNNDLFSPKETAKVQDVMKPALLSPQARGLRHRVLPAVAELNRTGRTGRIEGPVKSSEQGDVLGRIETCGTPALTAPAEGIARVLVCGNPGPASHLLGRVDDLVHISLKPAHGLQQLRSPSQAPLTHAGCLHTGHHLLGTDQVSSRSCESLAEETRALSPVNAELVRLVAKGLRNPEIERVTGMKLRTVRAHLSELYRLFEVTNRTELVGVLIERDYYSAKDMAGSEQPSGSPEA